MRFKVSVFPWDDPANERELRTAKSRNLKMTLKGTHSFQMSMAGESHENSWIEDLRTDAIVRLDGQQLLIARAGYSVDSIGVEGYGITFPFLDYRAVLARRHLRPGDPLNFPASTEQSDIVWSMVNTVQSRPNGDYGIVRGEGAVTGVTRERNFVGGEYVGRQIENMSNVINGFDWEVSPGANSGDKILNLYYPGRGEVKDVWIDNRQMLDLNRSWQSRDGYANGAYVEGEEAETTPLVRVASDASTDPVGLWDFSAAFPDISVQETLDDRADFVLAQRNRKFRTYNFRLQNGFWRGPNHFWLGDWINLRIKRGRINEPVQVRVFEIHLSIGDDGDVNVRIVAGQGGDEL